MSELTVNGRMFEIGEPNALHLVRLLAVIGKVGTRAEKIAANMGKALISQVIPNTIQEGEAPPNQDNLAGALFPFLAALTPDDLIEFVAALLQFNDEQEGVRWLKKNPPKLGDIAQAVTLTLENIGGIAEAIANFTTAIGGVNLAGLLIRNAEA